MNAKTQTLLPPTIADMPTLTRVVAVDDHEAIREGVRASLSESAALQVLPGAATVTELLQRLGGSDIDVVLLDLQLRDGSMPEDNVARLLAHGCDVIVYSSLASTAELRAALAAGALGTVSKGQTMAELEAAILSVARGEPLLTTEWAAALDAAPAEARPDLSERESEALRLYAMGLGMKSAARRMGISLGTYKEYLLRVRRKYASVDRPAQTKLALYHRAVEDGYLPATMTIPGAPSRLER